MNTCRRLSRRGIGVYLGGAASDSQRNCGRFMHSDILFGGCTTKDEHVSDEVLREVSGGVWAHDYYEHRYPGRDSL